MTDILTLRQATAADIETIAKLNRSSHQQNYREFWPADHLDSLLLESYIKKWEENFKSDMYAAKTWLAETEGRPIGFCRASVADFHIKGYPGFLDQLHILKEHTNKGHGMKMFETCRRYLLGELELEGFCLLVREKQEQARHFYEKKMLGQKLELLYRDAITPEVTLYSVTYGWKKI